MKRMLIAGCVVIAAITAFAGTNQVACAAQGKEDARVEARREREAQRKALEKIQGELKRQREELAAKVGRETHSDTLLAQPVMGDVFVRQIKYAKAQDVMRALSILTMESTKEAVMTASRQDSQKKMAKLKRNETMYRSGMLNANNGAIRGKVLLLADDRTNKLIVITSKANMDFFDRLIKELDTDVEEMPVARVLALRYAKARDVARNLSAIVKEFQKGTKPANDRFLGYPTATRPFVGKVVILVDERINGLIIVTSKINLPFLEHLIDELDVKLIDECGKKMESTPVPQCPAKKKVEPSGTSAPKP